MAEPESAGVPGTPDAFAIVGPTASGKTALGIRLAQLVGAEIISVDSRQIYRGMDVGTAKASAAQRAAVPHHGLDLVDPDERFSAGEFARQARRWIAAIRERGHRPLLVGGTGFWLRALTEPIFNEPPLDELRRERLRAVLERMATAELVRWLGELDPAGAARMKGGGGRQRLMRGIELPLLTGRTLGWWQQHAPPDDPPLLIATAVLDLPRATSDIVIDGRVDAMVAAGLVEEVEKLVQAGYRRGNPGMNATGYAELLPFLRGERSLSAALDLTRRNTRAYARRQRTWFRHQLRDPAPWLDGTEPHEVAAERLIDRWNLGVD